ncbi:hypothetical protein ACFL08_04580 [Patescibacteria group bacterium]
MKMRCITCSRNGLARVWYCNDRGEMVESVRLLRSLSDKEVEEFKLMAWKLNCPDCMKMQLAEVE